MRTRLALGTTGVGVGLYGAYLLLSRQDVDQLVSAGIWLAAGVLLHDAVLAPVVLAVMWLAARALPGWSRPAAATGFVVLGSVSIVAIPVLGRFGARSDNPTLLPRDYVNSWWWLAVTVVVAVVAAALVSRRRVGGESRERR
ncbi:hypothetical protein ACHAAC_13635 [Aeromicrobium sp. CF4.19]|uniref:hypothetical protein n=1 Tax=Aeromicrobium sp. CF4.19 TaxID=3373082 RepID=UPI003EE55038